MADSSTDGSNNSPNIPQITIDSLEEDERNCLRVVLDHITVLLLYISAQTALALETFYTYLGLLVGSWPLSTIMITLLFGAVLCTGLAYFRQDTSYDTWIPTTASALAHRDWVRRYFPEDYRSELAIVSITNESGSFTQGEFLARLAVAQHEVMNITVYRNNRGYTFEDICYRESQSSPCRIDSPLNRLFYNTDPDRIRAELYSEESNLIIFNIFHDHNPVDFDQAFGLVEKENIDGTEKVVLIRAATLQFRIRREHNFSKVAEDWEDKFISWSKQHRDDSLDISVFTSDTVEEESQQVFGNDIKLLSVGYILTFIYFATFLGKFNRKEHKLWVAILGILCIGFTLIMTAGLASYLQFPYGPVHSVIPFLLLGIGVDDMFVIVSSWQSSKPPKLQSDSRYSFIARYTAKCLGAVGVSITVTSVTNGVAFFVGAGTVLPSLSSFCIFAGIAILLLFLFQVTFFSAFVVIDYRRQQANLDALVPFIKLAPVEVTIDEQNEWDLMETVQEVFSSHIGEALVGSNIISVAVQLVVIFLTVVMAVFCGYGCYNLQTDIDIRWLFHPDSYAVKFIDQREAYFPDSGIPVAVYTGEIDYFSQQPELHLLNHTLYTDPTLRAESGAILFWFEKFISWMQSTDKTSPYLEYVTFSDDQLLSSFPAGQETRLAIQQAQLGPLPIIVNSTQFYLFLCEFLDSPSSAEVTNDIVIRIKQESPICGNCCVVATRGHATFIPLRGTEQELWAMEGIRNHVNSVPFSPERGFAYTEIFLSWETTYVIEDELIRNLIIATTVIFLITLLLVANWIAAILVLFSVALTMVDIAGSLYYWQLSINTVTAILLVLVVGLSVDYAAHVAHAFMRATGSRKERVRTTLSEIGPPVLNGGISTLLAFVLLAFSQSYIFQTFFKVFIGVVLFGLFHGLLLLPVLFGILGPGSHRTHFRSGISRRLELDDDFCDQGVHNALDIAGNFDVDLYEHHARMEEIAERISPTPLVSPTPRLQLFLNYQSSINSNQMLDLTPSQLNNNNNNVSAQTANCTVQESSI